MSNDSISQFFPEEFGHVSTTWGEVRPVIQKHIGQDKFDYRAFFEEMGITPDEKDLIGHFEKVLKEFQHNLTSQFVAALMVGCLSWEDSHDNA